MSTWLAGFAVSCSIDGRDPVAQTSAVRPLCAAGSEAARCEADFVERCDASGAWQRDPIPCELGCADGACVELGNESDAGGDVMTCGKDGDPCNDGQFCTVEDSCQAGECRGTPRPCDDGVACAVGDGCDEEADRCVLGSAQCPVDQVCDSASGACTSGCSGCLMAGVCYGDGAVNPVNPCQRCDVAASAVAFSPSPESGVCDDGLACTANDRCGNGSCGGTPLTCAADELCVEATGTCSRTVLGCSSAGQRICVDGDVHECDASLLSSRLLQPCDVGCDPTTVACVGAYALELEVGGGAVIQGSSLAVTLTLVRDEDHALPVEVTVLGLPPGVSADPLVLASTDDFATLTLRADARAAEGISTGLTVRASDGLSVVSRELELFVRGEPGSLDLSFGDDGTARAAPPGSPGFQGTRVLVDDADRVLVAATSRFILDPLDVPARASLTRFSADGALDTGFAEGGTYLETPGSSGLGEGPMTFLGGVALAADGYVLAGPLGEGFPQEASFLTRLDGAGNRANDFEAPTLASLRLSAVAVEGGSIFAAGASLSNAALYRSDLSGQVTLRFVDPSILAGMQTVFWSAADDDFILGGNCDPSACFARLDADRTPPELFTSTVTDVASSSASILDASADAQGRYFGITDGWNLVRFLPEPVRPPGAAPFTVVVDPLATGGGSPQGMERDGARLYVSAVLPDAGSDTGIPAVVRYSATWARDASFGSGGVAALDAEVEVGSSVDVAVQSDGRIILATVEQGELVVHRVWD